MGGRGKASWSLPAACPDFGRFAVAFTLAFGTNADPEQHERWMACQPWRKASESLMLRPFYMVVIINARLKVGVLLLLLSMVKRILFYTE